MAEGEGELEKVEDFAKSHWVWIVGGIGAALVLILFLRSRSSGGSTSLVSTPPDTASGTATGTGSGSSGGTGSGSSAVGQLLNSLTGALTSIETQLSTIQSSLGSGTSKSKVVPDNPVQPTPTKTGSSGPSLVQKAAASTTPKVVSTAVSSLDKSVTSVLSGFSSLGFGTTTASTPTTAYQAAQANIEARTQAQAAAAKARTEAAAAAAKNESPTQAAQTMAAAYAANQRALKQREAANRAAAAAVKG